MSTYIIERQPNKYGGQQQAYVEAVNGLIKDAAATFLSAVQSQKNITQLFHDTLAHFGKARHSIAKAHFTKSADLFGMRRDEAPSASRSTPFMMTVLNFPYDAYNRRLLSFIQKQLKPMKHDLYKFEETDSEISYAPFLGRASKMEFSILTYNELKQWTFTEKEYQRICRICEVTPIEGEDQHVMEKFNHLLMNKEGLEKLKEKSPRDYRFLKLPNIMLHLREEFPNEKKSDWIHVTVRSEINGKMEGLSEYLTWAYCDYVLDPVDRMKGRSVIDIIHQDPFSLKTMLNDIANVFKQAIEWNGEKLKDLKDQISLFRYELSHAMPFERGSSAVAEWFERAIYLYHGMNVTYTPKRMVDLEALTSSLKTFLGNYDSMIQLTRTEEMQVCKN